MSSSELELDSAESVTWSLMEFRRAGLGISELVIVGGELVSVSSVPRVDREWSSVIHVLSNLRLPVILVLPVRWLGL